MNIMNYATREVVTVPPDATIDKAISLMEEFDIHHLVVAAGAHVVGMVSDRDILLSTGWMLAAERKAPAAGDHRVIGPTRVDQIMSRTTTTLSNSDEARDAARIFVNAKIGALPVLFETRLIGLVTEKDLLRWLADLAYGGNVADLLLQKPVRELMRSHVISVPPRATLGDIVDTFRRYRIRHVPVAIGGELLGIVSDRDVRRALGWSSIREAQADEEGELFDGPQTASDVMQSAVRATGVDTALRTALGVMLEARIHSLPVVEAGTLLGMLTQTDFVKALAREDLL